MIVCRVQGTTRIMEVLTANNISQAKNKRISLQYCRLCSNLGEMSQCIKLGHQTLPGSHGMDFENMFKIEQKLTLRLRRPCHQDSITILMLYCSSAKTMIHCITVEKSSNSVQLPVI